MNKLKLLPFFLLFLLAVPATAASRHKYVEIQVSLKDLNNGPLKNIKLYGYCKERQLLFPKITDDSQYEQGWHDDYFIKPDKSGFISGYIPRGRWSFFGCGENNRNEIVCAWKHLDLASEKTKLILKPDHQFRTKLKISKFASKIAHEIVYIRPLGFPIYISATNKNQNGLIADITTSPDIELWTQGKLNNKDRFLINWGMINEVDPTNHVVDYKELSKLTLKGSEQRTKLFWYKPWIPGLSGELNVKTPSSLLVSSGKYLLGYQRMVGDYFGRFTALQYELSPSEPTIFTFNDIFFTSLATQVNSLFNKGEAPPYLHTRLFITDENHHLLNTLSDQKDKPLRVQANVEINGNKVKAIQDKPGETRFNIPNKKYKSPGRWEINIDLPGLSKSYTPEYPVPEIKDYVTLFSTDRYKKAESAFFFAYTPEIMSHAVSNLLQRVDQIDKRMADVSGRQKSIRETQLRVLNKLYGAGALGDHSGKYIVIPDWFYDKDLTGFRHTFVHELAHNYDFYHGGLMEVVAEGSRSGGSEIVYGQASKWLFYDRMNDIPRVEKWYPNTGIQLVAYTENVASYMKFMQLNDYLYRNKELKKKLKKEEIESVLLMEILKKPALPALKKYGLIESKSHYNNAFKTIENDIIHPQKYQYQNYLAGISIPPVTTNKKAPERITNTKTYFGLFFICVKGDAQVYINGKSLKKLKDEMYISPAMTVKQGDVISFRIKSYYTYRALKMAFVTIDNKNIISFRKNDFYLGSRVGAGKPDIPVESHFSRYAMPDHNFRTDWSRLGLNSDSDWVWGPERSKEYIYNVTMDF